MNDRYIFNGHRVNAPNTVVVVRADGTKVYFDYVDRNYALTFYDKEVAKIGYANLIRIYAGMCDETLNLYADDDCTFYKGTVRIYTTNV